MHKLLPVLVALVVIASLLLLYPPLKRIAFYDLQNKTSQKIKLTEDSASCSSTTFTKEAGEFDEAAQIAFYNSQEVDYPRTSLAQINQDPEQNVLAAYDSNGKEKWIEVSLTDQKLRAWEGNQPVLEFSISSGKWYPTPTGTFTIYWKLRYTRMVGGDKSIGTFYDLPNVPDTMYFYQGYGLHGAYWHNNFGHPMSHGCVNEPLNYAHQLFEWAGPNINPDQNSVLSSSSNPGSKVCIHYGSLVSPSSGYPQGEACPATLKF